MNTLTVDSNREQGGISVTGRFVLFIGVAWFLVVTAMALTASMLLSVRGRY